MLRREWRRALYALEGPPYCPRGGFYSIGISRRALVAPSGAEWGAISQRTRLYVVVKNREKRVTGGGGREIDVRQLEGGGRQGDRCEATGALWVAKVWEWMCASSGFWLLYTQRSSFTPYPCEALYTPKVLSAKLRKNLETYNL